MGGLFQGPVEKHGIQPKASEGSRTTQVEGPTVSTMEEAILLQLRRLLSEAPKDFKDLVLAARNNKQIEGYFAGQAQGQLTGYDPETSKRFPTPEATAAIKKYVKGEGINMKIALKETKEE